MARRFIFAVLFALLGPMPQGWAQETETAAAAAAEISRPAPTDTVSLEGRTIEAEPPADGNALFDWAKIRLSRKKDPYIVKLKTTATAEAEKGITELGGTIVSSDAAGAALLVRLTARQVEAVKELPAVDFLREFTPGEKVSTTLDAVRTADAAELASLLGNAGGTGEGEPGVGTVDVLILLYPNELPDRLVEIASSDDHSWMIHSRVQVGDAWKLLATVPISEIDNVASQPEVRRIELDVPDSFQNDRAGIIIGIPDLRTSWTGKNQIIGHADSGLDVGVNDATLHDDFEGRILKAKSFGRPDTGDWSDTNGHGTHTAATILGSGRASNSQYRGIAPDALLVHQSLDNGIGGLATSNLGKLLDEAYAENARVHSDSWGTSPRLIFQNPAMFGGAYGKALDLDTWAWNGGEPRKMLIVCAAGNAGPGSTTVGAPGTAKNCLTVGATGNGRRDALPDSIATFSSRGPTKGGRIKPDLVAPGSWIASARTQAARNPWQHDLEEISGWQAPAPYVWVAEGGRSGNHSWRYQRAAGETFQDPLEFPLLIDLPAGTPLFLEVSIRGSLPQPSGLRVKARVPPGDWAFSKPIAGGRFDRWTTLYLPIPNLVLGGKARMALEIYAVDPLLEAADLRIDDIRVTSFQSTAAMSDLDLVPFGDPVDRLYTVESGTSMATPVVAGAAALVREYLATQRQLADPTAELVKAILINGADRLGETVPNFDSGWGRINLPRSLPQGNRTLFFEETRRLKEGDTASFTFEVTDPSEELRVTLVWCDPPDPQLRHNLDLAVIDPAGNRRYPTGPSDSVNNVEGVDIKDLATGTWRVDVIGTTAGPTPRPFALVISGAGQGRPVNP